MNTPTAPQAAADDTTRLRWDSAAAGWNAHADALRAWLRTPTDMMLSMSGAQPGARVLDVAAGTGEQSIDAAARVGIGGYVLATDLSPACIALARLNVARAGVPNVECRVADAQSLELEEASFDVAICRLGLMLTPDPASALRRVHRALRPGGGVCTIVFSRPEANPYLRILMSTACKQAGKPPRNPFQPGALMSLGRPGHIDELFRSVGFRDVATTAVDAPFRMPSVDDYLAFVRASAGPVLEVLASADEHTVGAAFAEMREQLSQYQTANGWQGPNELLLTAARR